MKFPRFVLSLCVAFFLVSCQSMNSNSSGESAKNAIFFIGDGMGMAQLTAGRLYNVGTLGSMNYERFEFTGASKTYSSDNYTTDSAAAATALASGVKTYNGSIGMSDAKWESEGKSRRLQTLTELALKSGKSVGIITTTRITHATPASFFAHVGDRDMESEIAAQVVDSPVQLFIGGGRIFFQSKDKKGRRKDNRDILGELTQSGAKLLSTVGELKQTRDLSQKVVALLSDDHIEYLAKDKNAPRLTDYMNEAIRLLSQNPKGYFLMVEGGRIDHASHVNLAKEALMEMGEFDRAIGSAMDSTSRDDTLLVMTADHETGGLSISGYGPFEIAEGDNILGDVLSRDLREKPRKVLSWASGPGTALYPLASAAHTAVDVMVAASGPGAELFSGWMTNNEIALKIAASMNLEFDSEVNQEALAKLHSLQGQNK